MDLKPQSGDDGTVEGANMRRWERRGEYGLEIWEYQPPEPVVEGEEDAGDDGSGWLSVCTVHQPGEANARLLITAPKLLKALIDLDKVFDFSQRLDPGDFDIEDHAFSSAAFIRARDAIKAAKEGT